MEMVPFLCSVVPVENFWSHGSAFEVHFVMMQYPSHLDAYVQCLCCAWPL